MSWKGLPPSRHKEKLLGYRVKYRRLRSQVDKEISITSNFTEAVITRLDAQTEYEIEVNGFNKIGHGPSSKILVIKTASSGINLVFSFLLTGFIFIIKDVFI